MSAYGCWLSPKNGPSKNGNSALYLPRELDEIQQKVGLWGYLMQTTYQVSPSLKPFLDTS